MKKQKKTVTIDLTKWTTQKEKAASFKTRLGKVATIQYVHNMVQSGVLKSRRIEELGITLVEK